MDQWPLFLAVAFVAEVIGTMAGFGAATILTPVAALFMDMKIAIAVVTCFHLSGNLSRLMFFGKATHWRTVWQFGVPGVLFSLLGAHVTGGLPSALVTLLFGLFLLGFVGVSVSAGAAASLPKAPATLIGGGALSGVIAGLLGTGGAIRSACLLAFGLPKEAYLGTSAVLALFVDSTRLPVYVSEGLLPRAMWPVLGGLIPVAWLGAWTGQRLVRRVSPEGFRRFVLAMLALMGLRMAWEGWHGLA